MSTDQILTNDTDSPKSIPEFGTRIPFVQGPVVTPSPKVKRVSGIALRLRWKKFKAENFLKALEFGKELISYGTKKKAAVLSVMKQHHVNTREARLIIKDAKPKKHRSRS